MAGTIGGPMPLPISVSVPVFSRTWAVVDQDLDLVALGGAPARQIRAGGAGNLHVVYPGNSDSDPIEDTIPNLQAGETTQGVFIGVKLDGTTATNITVYW